MRHLTRIDLLWSNKEELDGLGMWHVCGRGEVHAVFWWINLKERNDMQETDKAGRIILK